MKTVSRLLSIIALTYFMFCLSSCSSEDSEPTKRSVQKPTYDFEIHASDKSQYTAVIRWGVNKIEYNENVKAWDYGSSFQGSKPDKFLLQVDSSEPLTITITEPGNKHYDIPLENGKLYEITLN